MHDIDLHQPKKTTPPMTQNQPSRMGEQVGAETLMKELNKEGVYALADLAAAEKKWTNRVSYLAVPPWESGKATSESPDR